MFGLDMWEVFMAWVKFVREDIEKDRWIIVYHRINKEYLKHGPGWHREVCMDWMEFNEDGTIRQVVPTP